MRGLSFCSSECVDGYLLRFLRVLLTAEVS